MLDEALDALGEVGHRLRRRAAAAALGHQGTQAVDRLLQFLSPGGRPGTGRRRDRRRFLGSRAGHQPVLQFVVEPGMGLARLQFQEAGDQRRGEAEQRGRERQTDARERHREAGFQLVEHDAGIAAAAHALDDAADRRQRVDEAPEGAEQAEQDQDPGDVAQDLAALVEAHRDRVEIAGRAGQGRPAGPRGDHRRHRRQQGGRPLDLRAVGDGVDVGGLAEQPDDLPEGDQDGDQQNTEDQPVEPGIGQEGRCDLPEQDEGEEAYEDQEDDHAPEIDPGLCQRPILVVAGLSGGHRSF
ncbi:hypothetical protein [Methylobacterium radiotolerans]|uniref:hypothetical protein n=1 Tax=Methylobacterium radiotolerans TaxID=31998 RepID=UPI003CC9B1C3